MEQSLWRLWRRKRLEGKKNDFIKQTGFGLSFAEWWIYYISWWFQANYDGGNFLHVGSKHLPGSLPCEIQLDEVKSSQWSPSKHQGQTSRRHPAGPYLSCCFFLHLQTHQRSLLSKIVRCALQADASSRHGHQWHAHQELQSCNQVFRTFYFRGF